MGKDKAVLVETSKMWSSMTEPSGSSGVVDTLVIDDEILLLMAEHIPDFAATMTSGRRASNFEHGLTNRDAFR